MESSRQGKVIGLCTIILYASVCGRCFSVNSTCKCCAPHTQIAQHHRVHIFLLCNAGQMPKNLKLFHIFSYLHFHKPTIAGAKMPPRTWSAAWILTSEHYLSGCAVKRPWALLMSYHFSFHDETFLLVYFFLFLALWIGSRLDISRLLTFFLRPIACRPVFMFFFACLRNVSPCLPPLGAMDDYDLHWTDVPGNDLDIYEPGDEEERHAFHQSQRRGNSKKRKQEAESLPPSDRLRWEPPSHTVVSEWPDGKRWGFWNNPEPLKCGRQELPSKPLAELPVDLGREAIQEIPKTGAVLWIIEAETDAGASARVPRFLLEEALETGRDCCIAIGVPQIAAARALADRVAEEAGEKVGNSVGLFTDEDKVQPMTRRSLSFATFGSLLRRVRRSIKGCCTLVLDEVHEASVELEFLLLAVKEILAYNKNRWTDRTLKVVLMSATPNIVKLREYFSEVVADVRHLEVPRGCPVSWSD